MYNMYVCVCVCVCVVHLVYSPIFFIHPSIHPSTINDDAIIQCIITLWLWPNAAGSYCINRQRKRESEKHIFCYVLSHNSQLHFFQISTTMMLWWWWWLQEFQKCFHVSTLSLSLFFLVSSPKKKKKIIIIHLFTEILHSDQASCQLFLYYLVFIFTCSFFPFPCCCFCCSCFNTHTDTIFQRI